MSEHTAECDWNEAKWNHPQGRSVDGTVTRVEPYGVWIDLGIGFVGLLLVTEMAGDGPKQLDDYPQVGSTVTATVIGYNDERTQFVLSQRV
jgi:small subunit ribosomal protein S1